MIKMLSQFPSEPLGWVLLIVAMLILSLANWLAVWGIESKTLARKKKGACVLVGVLGVLMFLIVLWLWSIIAGAMGGWVTLEFLNPPEPWPNAQYILVLGPIIVFLIYVLMVHGIIGPTWKNSTWISLLSLLILSLFLAFTPYMGEVLNFGIF